MVVQDRANGHQKDETRPDGPGGLKRRAYEKTKPAAPPAAPLAVAIRARIADAVDLLSDLDTLVEANDDIR